MTLAFIYCGTYFKTLKYGNANYPERHILKLLTRRLGIKFLGSTSGPASTIFFKLDNLFKLSPKLFVAVFPPLKLIVITRLIVITSCLLS